MTTYIMLCIGFAFLTAAATKEFWPTRIVEQKTEMVDKATPPVYGEVLYFAYDPVKAHTVFGSDGVEVDDGYVVQVQTQRKGEEWVTTSLPVTSTRYRVVITKGDALR